MTEQKSILIVDDENDILSSMQILLEGEGYFVLTAFSGEDALEKIGHHHIDLVITDVRMPGMDGFKLIEEIKKRTPDTKIMVMTGHANVIDAKALSFRLGASDFLSKPFEDILVFVQRIRTILS